MVKEVRGLRSTNLLLQNSHGDVKCSIGNIVAKEGIYMNHGHEQECRDCLMECGGSVWRGPKEEKLGQL